MTLGACEYCGHCERFGCEANAKASPNVCVLPVLLADPNFELRTHAYVKELVYDKAARKVTAVRYVDTRSGEEYEQPAGIVILGAYVFNNVLLMLTAGIGEPYDYKTGKGAVGKNYCYQVSGNSVTVFFEDKEINPFMAAGAHGVLIDDFNGDNFDHARPRLLRRRLDPGRPDQRPPDPTRPVPPGTPRWGREWKKATAKWYNHAFYDRRLRLQLRAPREFSRSRSDLPRRARPAADPHDLQFPRQRLQARGLYRRRARPARRTP